ncbi:MAG: hypothetical protein IJ728_01080 [Selenomonadaceae bacterium]|nr:hypothetical protein [Selenomonadaceae bacterium]
MIDLTTPIIPYNGTGIFKLNESYDKIKNYLKKQNIPYDEEISKPNDIDPQWNIIGIYKDGGEYEAIGLFFAKDRLFKITLCEDFEGALPNGIHIGMTIEEAKKIDKKLTYNDWEEDYESTEGYWLNYHRKTHQITIISIFIPALERDDFF